MIRSASSSLTSTTSKVMSPRSAAAMSGVWPHDWSRLKASSLMPPSSNTRRRVRPDGLLSVSPVSITAEYFTSSGIFLLSRVLRYIQCADWHGNLEANFALVVVQFTRLAPGCPQAMELLVCFMCELLSIEALRRMKLHLERLTSLPVLPLRVDSLVFHAIPEVLQLNQIEALVLQPPQV